ncbi:MAG: hypothetical protein WCA10_20425 [Terracidiphilus sp.]
MLPAGADPNPTHHAPVSDDAGGRSPKKNEPFRVYNRSREAFLSLEVAIFDTTAEPLKRLFDFLIHGSATGLWLKPYRGVPASQGARFFDLVYLDEENRVAWNVDHYPNPQFTVLEDEPASALLLPAHTIFASQLRSGDQLSICGVEELEGILETFAIGDEEVDAHGAAIAEQSKADRDEFLRSTSGPHGVPVQQIADGGEAAPEKGTSFAAWIKRWFSSESASSQRSNRQILPGLVAYHWSGGAPQPYQLGNISESGFFLLTDERPYPGTLILMTLQRTGSKGDKLGNSIAVHSKVIRWGPDGVGFSFVVPETEDAKKENREPGKLVDRKSLQEFLRL